MAKVKCPECGERFDRDNTPSQKISNRWYHLECIKAVQERNREKAENPNKIDTESRGEENDRRELIRYICEKYDMKKPSGMILKQIKSFREEFEYTYKGMELSLRFFFDLENHSVKEDTGIGIIPYVYDRAIKYHVRILEVQQSLEEYEETEVRQFKPRPKDNRRGRQLIDINEL